MQSSAFHDAGVYQAKGIRRAVVLVRRLLRRLLRPMLFQLDAELKTLAHRQDLLEQQLKAALALGWDHVALARRLAVIEDHLDELSSRNVATDRGHPSEGEVGSSIRYQGRDGQRIDGPRHITSQQSMAS